MQDQEKESLMDSLLKKVEQHVNTRIELAKLKFVDKIAAIISTVAAKLSLIFLLFSFVLMLSFAIAFWLGDIMESNYLGFFAVSGLYAILVLLFYLFRDKWIKTPISDSFIRQILK